MSKIIEMQNSNGAPMTPLQKRIQLSSALMTLLKADFPILEMSLTGIEIQSIESYIQATLIQYGNYINHVLGINRD